MAENKKSPLKFWQALPLIAKVGIIGGGLWGASKVIGGIKRRNRRDRRKLALAEREFDALMGEYKSQKFQKLDISDYAQENVYEDLRVDTEAADYAREQFQQQQANIMAGMRGVAGSSGIAGLAQVLSNQAQQQARETRLTIGQQIRENERIRLAEQARLNQQQRSLEHAEAVGARQFEMDKMTTLIGVAGSKVSGAQTQIAQRQQMYGQIAQGVGSVLGAVIPKINFG